MAPRAAAVSEQLVDELYRGQALRLTRMALLLVGDQSSAEDVVQDAFLGLFRGLDRLNDPSRAVAYLRVSVLNGCRSVLRGRQRARLRRAATETCRSGRLKRRHWPARTGVRCSRQSPNYLAASGKCWSCVISSA